MAEERRDVHVWLEMLAVLGAARGTLHVACALAVHAVPRLACFPSYATLTAKTRMQKSALAEHIGLLEGAGCLAVQRSRDHEGKQRNRYEMTWPEDVDAARAALVGRPREKGPTSAGAEVVTSAVANVTSAVASGDFRGRGLRLPPPRKGKGNPEGKRRKREEKTSLSHTNKIPRPSDDTPARGGFTGLDVLAMRPRCANGHAMRLAWNGTPDPDEPDEPPSWYSFCPDGCSGPGAKFDPVHEGVAKGKAADLEHLSRASAAATDTARAREPYYVPKKVKDITKSVHAVGALVPAVAGSLPALENPK